MTSIRARRLAHEETLPNVRWYSLTELAERWKLDPETVKAIPPEALRFKNFARPGAQRELRRYRADWVASYEEGPEERAA